MPPNVHGLSRWVTVGLYEPELHTSSAACRLLLRPKQALE